MESILTDAACHAEDSPWALPKAPPPQKAPTASPCFGPDADLGCTVLTRVSGNRDAPGPTALAPSCPSRHLVLQLAAVEAEAHCHTPVWRAHHTGLLEALAAHRAHGGPHCGERRGSRLKEQGGEDPTPLRGVKSAPLAAILALPSILKQCHGSQKPRQGCHVTGVFCRSGEQCRGLRGGGGSGHGEKSMARRNILEVACQDLVSRVTDAADYRVPGLSTTSWGGGVRSTLILQLSKSEH